MLHNVELIRICSMSSTSHVWLQEVLGMVKQWLQWSELSGGQDIRKCISLYMAVTNWNVHQWEGQWCLS